MNNFNLLREYYECSSKSINLNKQLDKNIHSFLNNYDLGGHVVNISIQKHGSLITFFDYTDSNEHIPLNILYDFCDEFGVDLSKITHECCTRYERGKNRIHYSHGKVYTIVFEMGRKGEM